MFIKSDLTFIKESTISGSRIFFSASSISSMLFILPSFTSKLGMEVKDGKIKSIDEILDAEKKILEPEIVDSLINVKSDLINIGQSKGKFGGGKRRIWRQTQRKTKEGNIPKFSTMAVVGDENGHVGAGTGNSKETLPAKEKAIRKAKLGIIKIK